MVAPIIDGRPSGSSTAVKMAKADRGIALVATDRAKRPRASRGVSVLIAKPSRSEIRRSGPPPRRGAANTRSWIRPSCALGFLDLNTGEPVFLMQERARQFPLLGPDGLKEHADIDVKLARPEKGHPERGEGLFKLGNPHPRVTLPSLGNLAHTLTLP